MPAQIATQPDVGVALPTLPDTGGKKDEADAEESVKALTESLAVQQNSANQVWQSKAHQAAPARKHCI